MKAEVKGWLVGILTLSMVVGIVPAGYVYATSTQEKLNQAQQEKKRDSVTAAGNKGKPGRIKRRKK